MFVLAGIEATTGLVADQDSFNSSLPELEQEELAYTAALIQREYIMI